MLIPICQIIATTFIIASSDLVKSIRQFGIINPLYLKSVDNWQYEIVNGNHRYWAAKNLGYITHVPAIILTDEQALESKLICSAHRKPIEYAKQLSKILLGNPDLTVEALAKKSPEWIRERLGLLKEKKHERSRERCRPPDE